MKVFTKTLLIIIGILLILTGGFFLILEFNVLPFADWLRSVFSINAVAAQYTMIFLNGFTVFIGLIITLIGIFKRRRLSEVKFQRQLGEVSLPVAAVEKDLQYRLVDGAAVDQPKVSLKVFSKQAKADVKIQAVAAQEENYQQIGDQILSITKKYLHDSLGFEIGKQQIEVQPITERSGKARVV